MGPAGCVLAEHYYRMLAKVRPLLFWISATSRRAHRLAGDQPARGDSIAHRIGSHAGTPEDQSLGLHRRRAARLDGEHAGRDEASTKNRLKMRKRSRRSPGGEQRLQGDPRNDRERQATADVLTLQSESDLTYRDVGSLLTLVNDRRRQRIPGRWLCPPARDLAFSWRCQI